VGKRGLEPDGRAPVDEEAAGSTSVYPRETPSDPPDAQAVAGSRPVETGVAVANVATALTDALRAVLTGDLAGATPQTEAVLEVDKQLSRDRALEPRAQGDRTSKT
jgi:hypothetical protein